MTMPRGVAVPHCTHGRGSATSARQRIDWLTDRAEWQTHAKCPTDEFVGLVRMPAGHGVDFETGPDHCVPGVGQSSRGASKSRADRGENISATMAQCSGCDVQSRLVTRICCDGAGGTVRLVRRKGTQPSGRRRMGGADRTSAPASGVASLRAAPDGCRSSFEEPLKAAFDLVSEDDPGCLLRNGAKGLEGRGQLFH